MTGMVMKKNSHAVKGSKRLLLGAYRRLKNNISAVQQIYIHSVNKCTDYMLLKNIDICA
jgi:hypothetical protein